MTSPAPWIESAKGKLMALSADAEAARARYTSLSERIRRLSESRNLKASQLISAVRHRDLTDGDVSAANRQIADLEREISGLDQSITEAERQMQAAELAAQPLFALRSAATKTLLDLNIITREEVGA